MNSRSDLYNLIKSLDKHEKRFFRLYVKQNNLGNFPQYAHLFDILDKMKQFDNTLMNKKLTKVNPDVNVSQVKKYLRKHILNALITYNKNQKYILKENEDINIAKILITKKVYKGAEKILLKLRKNAVAQENAQLLIQINTELISIKNLQDKKTPKIINQIEQYYEENLRCNKELLEKTQLHLINTKASKLYHSKERISENINYSFVRILEEDLSPFQSEEFLSKENSIIYYNLLFMTNSILYKNEAALKTIEKAKKIIRSPVLEYYPIQIATFYVNILYSYLENEIIEPFLPTIQEAQLFLDRHPELKPTHQYMIYLRELEFYLNVVEEKPSKQVLKKIIAYALDEENELPFTNKNMLLKRLASCYFKVQEYSTCQDILLKITLEHNVSIDDFYFVEVNLMEIICYYEMGVPKIAKQKIETLERKLKKSNSNIKNLLALIGTIKLIIKSKKEQLEHFQQLNDLLPENDTIIIANINLYILWVWVKQKRKVLRED